MIHGARLVELLGAHVRGSAEREPGCSQSLTADSAHCPRDAEVHHHGVPRLDEDVPGFDVAVDDSQRVRVAQPVGHLAGDPQRFFDGELSLPLQSGKYRFALHIRHHVVE